MESSVGLKKVEVGVDRDSAGDRDDGDDERQAPVVSFLPYQESLYFSVSPPPSFSSSALSGEPWLHNFSSHRRDFPFLPAEKFRNIQNQDSPLHITMLSGPKQCRTDLFYYVFQLKRNSSLFHETRS